MTTVFTVLDWAEGGAGQTFRRSDTTVWGYDGEAALAAALAAGADDGSEDHAALAAQIEGLWKIQDEDEEAAAEEREHDRLREALATARDALISAARAAGLSVSWDHARETLSAYVSISAEDGDDEIVVRFSDHAPSLRREGNQHLNVTIDGLPEARDGYGWTTHILSAEAAAEAGAALLAGVRAMIERSA